MRKPVIEQRLCPRVDNPCATPPEFARGQRSAFCSGCQKTVFNLSAMTAGQQSAFLARTVDPCVRYSRLIPALVIAMGSTVALAGDETPSSDQSDVRAFYQGAVAGKGRRFVEPMFIQNELDLDPSIEEHEGSPATDQSEDE